MNDSDWIFLPNTGVRQESRSSAESARWRNPWMVELLNQASIALRSHDEATRMPRGVFVDLAASPTAQKVYLLKFHLYHCIIQRTGHEVRGYIVAPSKDRAAMVVIEHDEALGLTHEDFSLERVDESLSRDRRLGLDNLLKHAPVGFASYCDIGWIAHTAPVQQLKLYRTIDDQGEDVFAVAPNTDVAASVFTTALRIPVGQGRNIYIYDGMLELPDEMAKNLSQLLELGPIGVAEYDTETKRWFVW